MTKPPSKPKEYRIVVGRRRKDGGFYMVALTRLPEIGPGEEFVMKAQIVEVRGAH